MTFVSKQTDSYWNCATQTCLSILSTYEYSSLLPDFRWKIQVANPVRKSRSQIQVANPGRKSRSQIQVANPGRKSRSQVRFENPGRRRSGETESIISLSRLAKRAKHPGPKMRKNIKRGKLFYKNASKVLFLLVY